MALPQILDFAAAAPLRAELAAARGAPLELDASAVERLGGLCVQVLLAAEAAWRGDGQAFQIINPSPAFAEAARLMGAQVLISQEGGR